MKFGLVWPTPIKRKLAGFNLPPAVEASLVETIDGHIERDANGARIRAVCFEATIPDGAGGYFDMYAWATYTSESGAYIVTDIGCSVLQ